MSVRTGGCHCGAVRFEVEAEPDRVLRCNCSICSMRGGYLHWIVPRERFRLTTSWRALGHYSFGTHRAKHFFCRGCGVTSFYHPRSHPDGVSINAHCVDGLDVATLAIEDFDGRNWERAAANLS